MYVLLGYGLHMLEHLLEHFAELVGADMSYVSSLNDQGTAVRDNTACCPWMARKRCSNLLFLTPGAV